MSLHGVGRRINDDCYMISWCGLQNINTVLCEVTLSKWKQYDTKIQVNWNSDLCDTWVEKTECMSVISSLIFQFLPCKTNNMIDCHYWLPAGVQIFSNLATFFFRTVQSAVLGQKAANRCDSTPFGKKVSLPTHTSWFLISILCLS